MADSQGHVESTTIEQPPASESPVAAVEIAETVAVICPVCGGQAWGTEVAIYCVKCGASEPAVDEEEGGKRRRIDVSWLKSWAGELVLVGVAIVVVSLLSTMVTQADTSDRTMWCRLQLAVGVSIALAAHFYTFCRESAEGCDCSPVDLILGPWTFWVPTVLRLPATRQRLNVMFGGIGLALAACFVVGRLDIQWGLPVPAKDDSKTVVQIALGDGEEEDMEDAMNKLMELQVSAGATPEEEDVETKPLDCVIIGYTVYRGENGKPPRLKSLVLAVERDSGLQYVGTVSRGLPDNFYSTLQPWLHKYGRSQPAAETKYMANWVAPEMKCRINVRGWNDDDTPIEREFTTMLGALRVLTQLSGGEEEAAGDSGEEALKDLLRDAGGP